MKHTEATKRKLSRIAHKRFRSKAERQKTSDAVKAWAAANPEKRAEMGRHSGEARRGRKRGSYHSLTGLLISEAKLARSEYHRKKGTYVKAARKRVEKYGGAPWARGDNNSSKRPEVRAKISRSTAEYMKQHPDRTSFSFVKRGWREDLGHAVRSSWEANTCRVLRFLGLAYQYEPRVFPLYEGTLFAGSYLPDLYVPALDCFIEVKGMGSTDKVRLFRKCYPKQSIFVIGRSTYREMRKIFSGFVRWELGKSRAVSLGVRKPRLRNFLRLLRVA